MKSHPLAKNKRDLIKIPLKSLYAAITCHLDGRFTAAGVSVSQLISQPQNYQPH